MAEEKLPHEKLADKELDLKAAQEVHYADDFKKADKAGKEQKGEDDNKAKEEK
ncbi:YfhE family protein [Planococcus chinensis]|uniref:YfhE family protein n=1 Tax=Planococcus chinensis TaxID=272917 RepID=A0ABW4QLM3_9BACL